MVNLSTKQTDAWWLLEDPKIIEVFFGGGAGAGKSWLGCSWQVYRRLTYPGTRGFIGRETLRALEDSTMRTYFDTLERLGLKANEAWTYNAQSHNLLFKNGSEQHFRHMSYMPSDPDEAPEVASRACQVLLSRLRYKHSEGCTPALLYSGNPGESWVKSQFVMDEQGNYINLPDHRARVLGTVMDNPDPTMRDQYARTLEYLDPYDRARLLDGDWSARQKAERPFAFAYDQTKHRVKATRRVNDEHHFSIDFNVEPFSAIAAHIWQDKDGPHFHTFAAAKLQNASIRAMAEWILTICPMRHLIKITGDRGGHSRTISTMGPIRLFDELVKELRISPAQVIVPPNPTHLQSREDCNTVLAAHPDCVIDPICTRLHADFQTVEVDQEGKIIKADRKQASQQADELDCWRYLVNTYLRPWLESQRRKR
jgi:hypothetical protein